MKTPDAYILRVAAEWLRAYEPLDDDADLTLVADWLDAKADATEVRGLARELGVSVYVARAVISRTTT